MSSRLDEVFASSAVTRAFLGEEPTDIMVRLTALLQGTDEKAVFQTPPPVLPVTLLPGYPPTWGPTLGVQQPVGLEFFVTSNRNGVELIKAEK